MALTDLLEKHRAAILQRWLQLIVDTYPADTARFLLREKDRFLNPVGYTIAQETAVLLDEIARGQNAERLGNSLDNMLRIRAVQEFPPSEAVVFVFLLKKAVRDELASEPQESRLLAEMLSLESRIDEAALRAFDIYMSRREKIYEIKANEVRRRSEKLMERLNRIYGGAAEPPNLDEPDSPSSD